MSASAYIENFAENSTCLINYQEGDSMERYPERCFHIIVPGQPKFDFNTSSISPLYETSYKNMIFYIKQIKIMSMPQMIPISKIEI